MIPKKSNKLYKEVAEDLEVSETLVGELVEFYYNEIRQLLSNLVCPRINVEGLGQFVIKPKLVRNAIPRYTKSLENHDTSTFAAYYNKKGIETKLELLILLEQKITEQELKKTNFKITKNESSIKSNLGEQEGDS
jgi:4-alpha-glucanotransferase